MYGKYLRVLLLAVRRIEMPVSGIHIFHNQITYVYLYVDTDELRRGLPSLLLIHLWNISRNGVLSHAHFAIDTDSISLKSYAISKYRV